MKTDKNTSRGMPSSDIQLKKRRSKRKAMTELIPDTNDFACGNLWKNPVTVIKAAALGSAVVLFMFNKTWENGISILVISVMTGTCISHVWRAVALHLIAAGQWMLKKK